ncbi:MAG: Co2+/Mg2+ efflux protein ApaG [Polyangiaceae bacterium]|jgi:ApaG protein|nr:Co2+/Mg2+ efflux protein ApaG [Polyangiaceae bacterium]
MRRILNEYASDTTTQCIRVRVITRYLPEQSDAGRGIRMFSYTVRISNEGHVAAQLLSRSWAITDAWGHRREVKGPGVVGDQPRIEPGQEFEYTSFCPLATASGKMVGSYEMVTDSGDHFSVAIGEFHLCEPTALN